ncbi:MAG: hypothetical protein WA895_41155 [Streptosporangiaceae bacterium]
MPAPLLVPSAAAAGDGTGGWRVLLGRVVVQRHPGDDEADAEEVRGGRDLAEDDQPDDRCRGREEGEHQGEGGARKPGHGELVGDVGDHRRAHSDADPPCQPDGMGEGRDGAGKTGRGGDDGGNEHGGAELVNAAHRSWDGPGAVSGDVGDLVAEGDVEHEPGAVGEGEDEPEGLAAQSYGSERDDPADGQGEGEEVSSCPGSRCGQDDGAEELDGADGR